MYGPTKGLGVFKTSYIDNRSMGHGLSSSRVQSSNILNAVVWHQYKSPIRVAFLFAQGSSHWGKISVGKVYLHDKASTHPQVTNISRIAFRFGAEGATSGLATRQ